MSHRASHSANGGWRRGAVGIALLVSMVAGAAGGAHAAFEIRSGPFGTSPLLGEAAGPDPGGAADSTAATLWVRTLMPYGLPGVHWHGLSASQRVAGRSMLIDASVLDVAGYGEWRAGLFGPVAGGFELGGEVFAVTADASDASAPAQRSAATLSLGYQRMGGAGQVRLWIRDALGAGDTQALGIRPAAALRLASPSLHGWSLGWRRSWEQPLGTLEVEDRLTVAWRPAPFVAVARMWGGGTRTNLTQLDLQFGRWNTRFWLVDSEVGLPTSSGFSIGFDLGRSPHVRRRPPIPRNALVADGRPQPMAPESPATWEARRSITELPELDAFELPEPFTEGDTLWAWEDSLSAEHDAGGRRPQTRQPRLRRPSPGTLADAGSGSPSYGGRDALGLRAPQVAALRRWLAFHGPHLPAVTDLPDSLQEAYLRVVPYLEVGPDPGADPGAGPDSDADPQWARSGARPRSRARAAGLGFDAHSEVQAALGATSTGTSYQRAKIHSRLELSSGALEIQGETRRDEPTRLDHIGVVGRAAPSRWGVAWSRGAADARWGHGLLPGTAPAPASVHAQSAHVSSLSLRRAGGGTPGSGTWWAWGRPAPGGFLALGSKPGRILTLAGGASRRWSGGVAASLAAAAPAAVSVWASRRTDLGVLRVEVARDPRHGGAVGTTWRAQGRRQNWRWAWGVDLVDLVDRPREGPRRLEVPEADRSLLANSSGRLVHARSLRGQLWHGGTRVLGSFDQNRRRRGLSDAEAASESRQARLRITMRPRGVLAELRLAHLDRRSRSARPVPSLDPGPVVHTTDLRARLRAVWPRHPDGGVETGAELGWAERARESTASTRQRGGWIGGWLRGAAGWVAEWTVGCIQATSLPSGSRITPSWVSGVSVARHEYAPILAGSVRVDPWPGGRVLLRAAVPLPGRRTRPIWVLTGVWRTP